MEIQQILGYLLNTSSKLIKRTMDDNLSEFNITTSQWAVLKLLATKGPLTQTAIAKELLGDKATAGEIILRLYEKKYVEKSMDKKDKRMNVVSLTPKAKVLINDMEKMAIDVTNKALDGLDYNDIQILNKSLNKIINNLSKEGTL
ncbi:MarR family winged helix-turn-helix transcriptional regulator [[Clostridium] fimetarium]|uniref:DNA-binding transcriptional regulator, MarR family n=1 Tax=[Clostridium] fimetarium TaxID=99656 RepID=A0A1I0QTK9_9FIRM|nr:MarR family transcriptional regulator [[Clostridium] fimetarium]SEW30736.1 DNA-binding transcriptional regulator, MarR family [[Clostridium] fimetarium]